MAINKHFFLSSILMLSSCFVSTNMYGDSTVLQAWKVSYLDQMTVQELQTIANIIHLLHANSVIELKVRQFSTPIARLNQAVREAIATYKNPAQDLATLKTLVERLSFVAATRTIYNQTLTTCVTHYNQKTVPMIDAALAALQLDAQTTLRRWAHEKSAETARCLKKSSDDVHDSIQHFQGASQLHKGMSEGMLPVEIPQEEKENKSLLVLSIILKNNPELYTVTENIINALNTTSDHATQIIEAGVEIYEEYYMMVYNVLMAKSVDKKHATTQFGMYDLLPEEYKSLLPDADHTFEHMLQTTKLYTQSEFSQS